MQIELKYINHLTMKSNRFQRSKNNQVNHKKQIAVSIMAAILLVLLYGVIFSFSEQDGKESGNLSQMVSEKCVELLETIARRDWTQNFKQELTEYFEHPIRKLAHFCEYACMGFLGYELLVQWIPQGRRLYLLTVGWVFVSAAADELHQRFVPGRYGCFADVILDTCGGIFGMWVLMVCFKLLKAHKRKTKKRT